MGTFLGIDGGIIASNHITLGGGSKAGGILHITLDSLIANNKIAGSGFCAAGIMPFQKLNGCRIILVGNEVSRFKASMADVFLQTQDNIIPRK